MGYPGDEGGSPPDTRAGAAPHRTAVWASDTGQERPKPASARPGDAAGLEAAPGYREPPADAWGPAVASSRPPAWPTAPWIPGPSTRQPQLSERQSRAAAAAAPAGCYGPGGIPGAEPRDAPAGCGRPPAAQRRRAAARAGRPGAAGGPVRGTAAGRPGGGRVPGERLAPPASAALGRRDPGQHPPGQPDRYRPAGRRIAVELGRVPHGRAGRARPGPRLPARPGSA